MTPATLTALAAELRTLAGADLIAASHQAAAILEQIAGADAGCPTKGWQFRAEGMPDNYPWTTLGHDPRVGPKFYEIRELITRADHLAALTAAQARAEAVEWISVDERLPEKNTEVLVAFKGISIPSTGQYTGAARDKHGWCYPSENYNSCDDGSDPVVIAWQPLPATDSAIGGKGA